MTVCYNKLFKLLFDEKMTNDEFVEKAGYSVNIISQIKRDKKVSRESVEKICNIIKHSFDDFLEFVTNVKFQQEEM